MDIPGPSSQPLPPLMREGGDLSPKAVAALCEHRSLRPPCVRCLTRRNVRLYRGDRILNYVGYDRGRLIVGMMIGLVAGSRVYPASGALRCHL